MSHHFVFVPPPLPVIHTGHTMHGHREPHYEATGCDPSPFIVGSALVLLVVVVWAALTSRREPDHQHYNHTHHHCPKCKEDIDG